MGEKSSVGWNADVVSICEMAAGRCANPLLKVMINKDMLIAAIFFICMLMNYWGFLFRQLKLVKYSMLSFSELILRILKTQRLIYIYS